MLVQTFVVSWPLFDTGISFLNVFHLHSFEGIFFGQERQFVTDSDNGTNWQVDRFYFLSQKHKWKHLLAKIIAQFVCPLRLSHLDGNLSTLVNKLNFLGQMLPSNFSSVVLTKRPMDILT